MHPLSTIGIVGAGTMGSAMAQKFAQEGFTVILCDRAAVFVDKGLAAIERSFCEGVTRKVFTSEEAAAALHHIRGTEKLDDLAPCDLVIEAIFEDFKAKSELFRRLGDIVSPETIVASNTSSFAVSDLARTITHPERFIGLHYFYHAAKNRLVEIIPGALTSRETIEAAEQFCSATGKEAIHCRDRNGFALNRFFVPWLNEAVRLFEEKVAPMAVIDRVCRDVFGIGMGPFALMNLTGIPIAYHAQRTLEALGSFYAPSDILKEQAAKNLPWVIEDYGTENASEEIVQTIRERMLAAVFLVCGQILEEHVCSASDLDRGARIGLKWAAGPIAMMRARGKEEVDRLVRLATHRYQSPFPCGIKSAFEAPEFA